MLLSRLQDARSDEPDILAVGATRHHDLIGRPVFTVSDISTCHCPAKRQAALHATRFPESRGACRKADPIDRFALHDESLFHLLPQSPFTGTKSEEIPLRLPQCRIAHTIVSQRIDRSRGHDQTIRVGGIDRCQRQRGYRLIGLKITRLSWWRGRLISALRPSSGVSECQNGQV